MSSRFSVIAGLPDQARPAAARLYWEAFAGKIGPLMGPQDRGLAFLERVIDPDFALSALSRDGALLGVAGFKTEAGAFVGGGLGDLAAIYGAFGAAWRALPLAMLERPVEPGRLLMDGICVAAHARSMGIGSALLDATTAAAAGRGLREVRLDVIDINPRARALYERKGFVAGRTQSLGPLKWLFGFSRATTMTRAVPG